MSPPHDAFRHTSLLRQALDNPKRPIALLLGAGCPLSITDKGKPLIPDIDGMTNEVARQLEAGDLKEAFATVKTQLKNGGSAEPNVEDYLSHVRTLREVAQKVPIDKLDKVTLNRLDELICNIIVQLSRATLPTLSTPYHHLASWARGAQRAVPVELFTTNYDLLLEQALEECRVPYFDGFIGSRLAFFDPYAIEAEEAKLPARWARLWKLHGSINWWSQSTDQASEVIRSNSEKAGVCRLIHPSHLKYEESRQMPYLAMLDRLKSFLGKPRAVLVICGYSFRDKHINSLIAQALAGNQDAIAFGLLYGDIKRYSVAARLANVTPNLCLMAKDAGIVGTRQASWESKPLQASDPLPAGIVAKFSENEETAASVEITLGDFAQFGSLLQQLIGNVVSDQSLNLAAEEQTNAT